MEQSTSLKNRSDLHVRQVKTRHRDHYTAAQGIGLNGQGFRQVASNGFGDGHNSYAFSMAWYENRLYVGTVRDMLALIKASPPKYPAGMTPWPVPPPANLFDLDLRSQIWRYTPPTGHWERIYVSPMVPGPNGQPAPRDIGYRHMVVAQGPGDRHPALYIATASSNSRGPGAHILRYTKSDGIMPVSKPGLGDKNVSTFRMLVAYEDRLYTSPTGSGRAWNAADRPRVFETRDSLSGRWYPVSVANFGDPTNDALYSMAVFNDYLYVGTLNAVSGYQVWKARPVGQPPYRWVKVVDHGAGRGNLNEAAVSMCVFNNALYVGSGISNGGYDRTYQIGPAAGEVIRIHPDDSWDLVCGTARSTPQGYKHPISALGPGFSNPFAGYIWNMAVHDGRLYVGTFDSAIFAMWADLKRQSPERLKMLQRIGVDIFVRERAGFDLWCTKDGVHWQPVTQNGFGNPYNYGVRTMQSTPVGLFVGTANPFGPQVAARFAAGWEYVPNPRGGCEVWLGSSARRAGHLAEPPLALSRPALGNRAAGDGHSEKAIRTPLNQTISAVYDSKMYDPLVKELYRGTDFYNFGYWLPGTATLPQACANLMEQLLAFVPAKQGRILDVACGKGATTQYLTRYYKPRNVVGVNMSDKQLETCRKNAPGCKFYKMDAVRLDLEDDSFDTVISVEAAFHFKTRERFFHEAWRVLRSGGYLVLSDILFAEHVEKASPVFVAENYVRTLNDYHAALRRAGFTNIIVRDVTQQSWIGHTAHLIRFWQNKLAEGRVDPRTYQMAMTNIYTRRLPAIRFYLLAAARKP